MLIKLNINNYNKNYNNFKLIKNNNNNNNNNNNTTLDLKIICGLINKTKNKLKQIEQQSRILRYKLKNYNNSAEFYNVESAIQYLTDLQNEYNLYYNDYIKYVRLAAVLDKRV